ncbi:MAG TPA: arylamine N-acetyltransferase, partial [Steroidobacteraceae bacterium]
FCPLVPPRIHMALKVYTDGKEWLCDVGFGSRVPTAPLMLETTVPQKTPIDTFRIQPSEEGFRLEVLDLGEWAPLYDLGRAPQFDIDYQVANWYTAAHPDSLFRRELIVARTTDRACFTLLGDRLTVRTAAGQRRQEVVTAATLGDILQKVFLLPSCAEIASLPAVFASLARAR